MAAILASLDTSSTPSAEELSRKPRHGHAERLLLQWLRTAMNLEGFGFLITRVGSLGRSGEDPYAFESGAVGAFVIALGMIYCSLALHRYVTNRDEKFSWVAASLALGTIFTGLGLFLLNLRILLDFA